MGPSGANGGEEKPVPLPEKPPRVSGWSHHWALGRAAEGLDEEFLHKLADRIPESSIPEAAATVGESLRELGLQAEREPTAAERLGL
jgi:hypothetical protein